MDDDEFDLPNAEEYFTEPDAKPASPLIPPELLDEFDDVDFDEYTAAQHCLALPELLERIILNVPKLEVFRLQRVNTMFRDLIARSIPIRRHMYFVPEKYYVRSDLNQAFGARLGEKSKLAEAVYPFRMKLYSDRNGAGIRVFPADQWVRERQKTAPDKLFLESKDVSPKNASWRTILILDSNQPLEVYFYVGDGMTGKCIASTTQLSKGTPTTLGDVVDYVKLITQKIWKVRAKERAAWIKEVMMFAIRCPIYYDDDD